MMLCYSEPQTDYTEEYTETEDYETEDNTEYTETEVTEESDSEEEESDENGEAVGGVDDLLDEAMDDTTVTETETESECERPVPAARHSNYNRPPAHPTHAASRPKVSKAAPLTFIQLSGGG